MHSNTLANIAAWVALHAQTFANGEEPCTLDAQAYWVKSKCRINRWNATLKLFGEDLQDPELRHNPWPALEVVIQEIVVSEMLTRVMAAAFLHCDQLQNAEELRGIGNSLFVSHMETRNRAVRILLSGREQNEQVFDRINHIRRQAERWTDLFLSRFHAKEVASKYAFDPSRVEDFSLDHAQRNPEQSESAEQLLMASMRANLNSATDQFSANPDLNRQIGAGAIGCFAIDRFDSYGLPKSARMLWLEKAHMDTESLLAELKNLEASGVGPQKKVHRVSNN